MSLFAQIFKNADRICGGMFLRGMNGELTAAERSDYMERYADQEERVMGKPMFEMTDAEFEEVKTLQFNGTWGKLNGKTCRVCLNKGFIMIHDGKYTMARTCECVRQAKSEEYELMSRCSFENYAIKHEWQRALLSRAKAWTRQAEYPFLYLGGKSGTGKTHLAISALAVLMRKGHDVLFVNWREESRDMKMQMTDFPTYNAKLERLKRVNVLFIDDFLWAPRGGIPSDEDFRLSKEIVDVRTARGLKTIITANYTVRKLCELSEEIGGRINYAAGGSKNFAITIRESAENYRMELLPTVEEIREGDYDPCSA